MSLRSTETPLKAGAAAAFYPHFPTYRDPILPPLDRARREIGFIASDPLGFCTRIANRFSPSAEDRVISPQEVDHDWDAQLHAHFGLSRPCQDAAEISAVWGDVLARMSSRGITAGPMSYLGNNDGDLGLARAVWCLVRHLKAVRVVETGVAHGVTSRFILEALARNGGGRLWSIDLPPLRNPKLRREIGVAVDKALQGSWRYIEGTSRRHLPGLLRRTAPIDLFIHDSKHSTENVLFELKLAWSALRPGGAIVVDDIDTNSGFHLFCEAVVPDRAWICPAEPVRPDERRANRKGYFGVIMKAK